MTTQKQSKLRNNAKGNKYKNEKVEFIGIKFDTIQKEAIRNKHLNPTSIPTAERCKIYHKYSYRYSMYIFIYIQLYISVFEYLYIYNYISLYLNIYIYDKKLYNNFFNKNKDTSTKTCQAYLVKGDSLERSLLIPYTTT